MKIKKLLSVFLAAVLTFGAVLSIQASAEEIETVSLIKNRAIIAVSENCDETDLTAANYLQEYVYKITSVKLEIKKANFSEYRLYFAIGNANYLGMKEPALDGYTLESSSRGIKICGNGTRGTIRGVFAFLEKYCDCHWYAHDCITYPTADDIVIPADINESYTPSFEFTMTDTISSRDVLFNIANGQTGGSYCSPSNAQGGTVSYVAGLCHTLSTTFCSYNKYFTTHPEYFAFRDGERQCGPNTQLCLTNPDVVKVVTNEVLEILERNKNTKGLKIVSLTQDDNYHYCECEKCKALDDLNGSHAGTMLNFVNQVADAVKEAGYGDDVVIDTFAYQYTRAVPAKVVPRDNVCVRLCSIECCFAHTLDDKKCKDNVEFMKDLEGWSKISNRLYIWDYVNNYGETDSVFPNFNVLQKNIQTFKRYNVKGIYEEGNYYIAECDAEFGELKTYLLSKCLQNPDCDFEKEMNGFLQAYYGPGWENIKEYIDIITACNDTYLQHMSIGQPCKKALPKMNIFTAKKCNNLWSNAKEQAENDIQLKRIRKAEISWRYWKSTNRYLEFSHLQKFTKWMGENEKLHDDMLELGILKLNEGGENSYINCSPVVYRTSSPTNWKRNSGESNVFKQLFNKWYEQLTK